MSIQSDYISHFIDLGREKLFKFGYLIETGIIDGPNGVTSINLISRTNGEFNKVVSFAYNSLDYNLGVIVYGTKKGKIDYTRMLLPKSIQVESDTYGFMGINLTKEILRLIEDICTKLT